MVTTLKDLELVVGREPVKTAAYIMYRGERVDVKVESTFQGGTGLMANVKALQGYPFYSADVQSQGETHGAWNCNGYRVRADFVNVEVAHDPEDYAPHPVDQAQRVEREIDETLSRTVAESDGRNPAEDKQIKGYFGKVKVTTSADWRKRHLNGEASA